MGTLERLERAFVIYLFLPCNVVFDPEEWQAAWIVAHRTKPSETPPPLGQMVRLIAGFGGFLGRKHDGHPGPKALWEGMQRVREFALPWKPAAPCMPVTGDLWVIGCIRMYK